MLVKALALAATLAVASAVVLKHEVDLDSPLVDVKTKYNAWKSKFGKVYDTIEAEAKAMKTFAANDQFVLNHNKEGHSYTVGHNEFSDLTSAEFAEQLTGYKTRDSYLRRTKNYNNELLNGFEDAPTSIDWTTKGAVTPVKNQGQCGSCWAFSTTGSTEGAYAISSGKLVSLSEQNLVDCDHNGDNGCNGGLMDNAFGFIIQNGGICTEQGYPYTAADGTCQTSCQKAVTITGHEDVPKNDEKSLLVAAAKGPVSIAIEADKPAFQMYKSGVFDNPSCGTQLDHGVLIVGYGTDSGKDYWKVKNSWGAAWGDQGYIRIVRNKNMCGISLSACYPTGAKAAPPSPGPAPGPSPGPAPGPSPGPAPGPPGPPGPIPTVATEWSANVTQVVKLANGQTKSAAGTSYQSAKHNATRFDGNGKTIISLYGNINKEMLVVDGKCQAYCPVSGTFFNRIQPGTGKKGLSKATNRGTVTINGKQTTDWEWKQLLVIIQMALVDLYLDSNQHPVVLNTEITPFNKPLGNSTETFNSFIPGDLPEGTFAVSGIETCPKSSGCQNQKGLSSFLM